MFRFVKSSFVFFGVALGLSLATAAPSAASVMVISSTSFDYQYVPNVGSPGLSALCDGQSCNGGNGTVANADPVTSMSFTVLGAPNVLAALLTTNIYIDMNLQLGGFLQLGGSQTITGGIFDLFTKSTNPGWGLAINVTGGSVFVNSNGGLSATLVGSASGVLCGSCVPNNSLPISGLLTGPFTISFSSITNLASGAPGSITTAFTANGSPDVTGNYIVPEPATLAVIGMALLMLFGLGTMRKRTQA
jgi:hypothetical protein